jgi:rRNA maturation endonuclease Nob1
MGRLDRLWQWARPDTARPAEAESTPAYACRGCGAGFEMRYHVCPECGGFSVDRRLSSGD